jgi:succinate dehydrogenase flavin-adding protein (antitoxin of CptAB toxin-antitoxin module)
METPNDNGARDLTQESEDKAAWRQERAHNLLLEHEDRGVVFWTDGDDVRFRPARRVGAEAVRELRILKAEVLDLLRGEEEDMAVKVSQPEVDPMPNDEYEEFKELTDKEQDALFRWIGETLEAAPPLPRTERDSYELKHIFARTREGFYTTNGQFRAAMWLSGHLGRQDGQTRYYYLRARLEGLVDKLERAGIPRDWTWDAIMCAEDRRPGEKEI